MYILGLNIGHDATAVLLKDGRIAAAIAEERVSRVKFHFGFPYGAIREVMRIEGITGKDIHKVVLSFDNDIKQSPFHLTDTIVRRSGTIDPSNEIDNKTKFNVIREMVYRKLITEKKYWKKAAQYAEESIFEAIKKCGITEFTLSTQDHHYCHAATAYYEGGQDRALIVTMDGAGDGLCATVSTGIDGDIRKIAEVSDYYSLGRFYSAITKYLGFKRNRHEGKITGLAAYGNPEKLYKKMKQLIDLTEDGKGFKSPLAGSIKGDKLRMKELGNFIKGTYYGHNFTNLYMDFLRTECANESREDIAAACQKLTEDLVVEYIKPFLKETGMKHVMLAGGIFANVKVNQRVLEMEGVESIFVHPNMGDGGSAAGAAYIEHCNMLKAKKEKFIPFSIETVYYGPSFNDDEILERLKQYDVEYRKSDNVCREGAELISKKTVVGWFQGRMEYGPRALGNRSILFDPTDKSINDWLNKRLKRTEFMPFAPSGLIDGAEDVFVNYKAGEYPSYFMTITFDVKEQWQKVINAVNHVDNTARPQIVKPEQNELYYGILQEYRKISDLPLFVNTSFNMHEEPIVCTPDDAIRSLLKDCVDVLIIGNYVVRARK